MSDEQPASDPFAQLLAINREQLQRLTLADLENTGLRERIAQLELEVAARDKTVSDLRQRLIGFVAASK